MSGQIASVGRACESRSPAEGFSSAFDIRRKLVHPEDTFLPFGKMHLLRGEYHKPTYFDPLQGAMLFQDSLQCPHVAFILQNGGTESHDFFFIKLNPFLLIDLNSSVMAFGFDDEQSPFANENVVQLGTAPSALQIYVVKHHGAGEFPFQRLGNLFLGFVAEMQNLRMALRISQRASPRRAAKSTDKKIQRISLVDAVISFRCPESDP